MEMKPMPKDLPFALLICDKIENHPFVHGYADEETRDRNYDLFQRTGQIIVNRIGFTQTIQPFYVARFNMVDGTMNYSKLEKEIG